MMVPSSTQTKFNMTLDDIVVEKKALPPLAKGSVVVTDKNFGSDFNLSKVKERGEMHVSDSVGTVKFFTAQGRSTRTEQTKWYAFALNGTGRKILVFAMSKGSNTEAEAALTVKQTQNANGREALNAFYAPGVKALWNVNDKNIFAITRGKFA